MCCLTHCKRPSVHLSSMGIKSEHPASWQCPRRTENQEHAECSEMLTVWLSTRSPRVRKSYIQTLK